MFKTFMAPTFYFPQQDEISNGAAYNNNIIMRRLGWYGDLEFSSSISPSLPLLCGLCSGQSWGAFGLLVPLSISCLKFVELLVCAVLVIYHQGDRIGVFLLDLLSAVSGGAEVFGSGGLELLWCSILALQRSGLIAVGWSGLSANWCCLSCCWSFDFLPRSYFIWVFLVALFGFWCFFRIGRSKLAVCDFSGSGIFSGLLWEPICGSDSVY
ncbi:hypothetical protein ACOSP7_004304 [Xanthoceras sorbifolium]